MQNRGIKQAVVSLSLGGPKATSLNDAVNDLVNVSCLPAVSFCLVLLQLFASSPSHCTAHDRPLPCWPRARLQNNIIVVSAAGGWQQHTGPTARAKSHGCHA